MAQETKKVNITIEAGANFQMYFTVRDDAERLIDLTGCTVEAQLREYAEASDYLEFTVTHNGSGGRVSISMPFEDTAAIPYDSGVYDVYITDTDNIREKYLEGDVEITPAVTKPVAGEIIYLLSFASEEDFPSYGMVRRLYFSHASNHMYRWNGTAYVDIVTDGEAATVEVGDVETLPAGSDATVENVGSLLNAVFNFGIPEGNGIESIEKTDTDVLTDTYTITFTDPNVEAFDFDVVNGRGITAITKTSSGLTDTYTVSYNDGTEYVFNLHNGNGIESIDKSTSGLTDTYTLTFHDGSTLDMVITNGKGITSVVKTTSVLDDTYTVTWNDGTVTTYTISNGKGIVSIEKTSTEDLEDEYTVTFNDGDTFTYTVTNGMDCTHSWNGTVLTITSASGTSSADLQGTTDYEQLTNVPETFPPEAHNHDDRYYTETEMDTALATKATTTALSALENSTIAALALKANASDVYAKTDIDSALAEKADSADLGELADHDTVDYETEVTNKPDLNIKAPAITETASGSIASFSDGSASPVTALSVGIEPVQDLHGYDNPWPAGGGKNLFPDKKYQNSTTTVVLGQNTSFDTRQIYLPVGTYTVSYTLSSSNAAGIYYRDSVDNTNHVLADRTYSGTFTVTEAQNYVFWLYRSGGLSIDEVLTFQIESGETATSWTPYSNICPISEHTSATVTRTGKNLLPDDGVYPTTKNGITVIKNADGSLSLSGTKTTNGVIFTVHNFTDNLQKYQGKYLHSQLSKYVGIVATYYDENNRWISVQLTKGIQLDIPQNAKRMQIAVRVATSSDVTGSTLYPMISDYPDDTFEPYQGTSVTIDLDGTRYGGTLDVTTGMLTVTKALITKNTASMNNLQNYPGWKGSGVKAIIGSGKNTPLTIMSNIGTSVNVNTETTNDIVFLSKAVYGKTQDEWIALAMDVQMVFNYATPVTVQLTPAQMQTLLGENHIFADTGDVAVTYRADTKLFIEEQIAESQRATRSLIAGIETAMVASKNYAEGDLLIVGDALYKTLSSIASGATLTVGTNVAVTTVAEQLIALANA